MSEPRTLDEWAARVGDEPAGGLAGVAVEGAEVWPEAIAAAQADGCPPEVVEDMRSRERQEAARSGPLVRGDSDHGGEAYGSALDLYAQLVATREAPTELVLDALDLAIRVRSLLVIGRDP